MRALAAAFEADALHVALPRIAEHQLADFGRAGERDHVDIAVEREGSADGLAEPRQYVEDAVRETGLGRQGREADGRERGLFGGLQDDGIAGQQGGSDLPGRDDQRVVPGHDRGHDTERLAPQHGGVVRADRRQFVDELVGHLAVILDAIGREGHIDREGIADHLADVERFEQRQLVEVLADQRREAQHHGFPGRRRDVTPAAVLEGTPGAGHGRIDIGVRVLGHLGDDTAVDRRNPRESPAGGGADVAALDEGPALDTEGRGARFPAGAGGGTIEHGKPREGDEDRRPSAPSMNGLAAALTRPERSGRDAADRRRRPRAASNGSWRRFRAGPSGLPDPPA